VLLVPPRFLHRLLLSCVAGGLVFKLAAPVFHVSFNPFRPLPGCIDSLGLGALLALYQHTDRYRQRFLPVLLALSRWAVPVFLLLTVIRIGLDVDPWYGGNFYLGVAMFLALGFASVAFLHAGTEGGLGRVVVPPALQYIGAISYGIYVHHFFAPLLVGCLPLPALPWSGTKVLRMLLEAGLAVGVAALSFRYIERPFLALKERFAYAGRQGGGRAARP